MRATEINALLVGRIEEVCTILLPGGKRKGAEWCAGSTGGEAGDSLKVHLAGQKAGIWRDFASSEEDSGNLLTLWQRTKGCDFGTAIKQAKDFLGVQDVREDKFERNGVRTKTYVKPKVDEIQPLLSGGEVYDYLTKIRQLDPAVLHRYKIGQMFNLKHGHTVVFQSFEPSRKTVDLLKFLAVDRGPKGEKNVWSSSESRDRLFGWQALKGDERNIVISEGEIDALTIAGWGFAALSLPRGTNAHEWIEHDYDMLEQFEKIYLCFDMDGPGHKAAEEVAQRLGRERCYRIFLPDHKDANEALCSGKFIGPDFEDCIAKAKTLDPAHLRNIAFYRDSVRELFWPTDQRILGTNPPIDIPWKCRAGELTIWTGFSGHGKSLALNHFLLHDASQGERCCIASMEIAAVKTIKILALMLIGREPKKDENILDTALEWLADKFWIFDQRGAVHWSKILPVLDYAARRYHCTRFAIDSMLFCGISEDDYDGQKEFVSALTEFSARLDVHVHLVAHSRKKDDESKHPGKLDVRGAGAITDMCHNGFTVWRNKAKEQKLEEMINTAAHHQEIIKESSKRDGSLSMWKNRETGEEPFRPLWLHKPSGQFLGSRDGRAINYLNQ